MANIAEWIEEAANGEAIEAVVIGTHYRDIFKEPGEKPFNEAPLNTLLTWEEAKPFLSYEFDNGFGGADCHPVYAWTKTRIIVISEYDGATGEATFPRNPIACKPEFA